MKSGLVTLLTAQSAITAIVASRVYINRAPQKAEFPYVVITQMEAVENGSLGQTSGQLRFVSFDIDCKAKSSIVAETLGRTIRTFIDDYSGAAGAETIRAVLMNDELDDYEQPTDGSDTGIYVVTLDVEIQYTP